MNADPQTTPITTALLPTDREVLPWPASHRDHHPVAGRVGGLSDPPIADAALQYDVASDAQYRPAPDVATRFAGTDDAAPDALPADALTPDELATDVLVQESARDGGEGNEEFSVEDYTPPSLAELSRTRASEYTLGVLQARTTRTTTIERGTAGLAAVRDELYILAQQLFQPSEHGLVPVAETLAIVKQLTSLQRQIGQDYQLIARLEKHGP